MTALKKYQKLESPGLWREGPQGQRREVVANLGDTTLILSDPKRDVAVAHWSLPAVLRLNPGELPALFAPGGEDGETLELDDPDMIAALETVHHAIEAARPHPGRLRNVILATITLAVVGGAAAFLPDALVTHTASVLPAPTRADIGRVALSDLSRLSGQPCTAPRGERALKQLGRRLFPGETPVPLLIVVREGPTTARALPGPLIVLPESLLAEQDGPDLAAGHILAAATAADVQDPMLALLRHAGLGATFGLLTSGQLAPDAVAGYAEALLRQTPPALPDEALLARFASAGLPSSPYAYALDATGETTLGLIEADPFATTTPPALLTDEDWVSLQDICGG